MTSELQDVNILLLVRKNLDQEPTVKGFYISIDAGASVGQTGFQAHVHLIPGRDGDVVDPRGGVRGVIPSKQRY